MSTSNNTSSDDLLYTDLENSFISFLRDDPTRTTTVPATMAAQHFEVRIEALLATERLKAASEAVEANNELHKLNRQNLLDAVEAGLPEKRELVNSRPPEWDDHYHTKWNATQEGYNYALSEVKSILDKLRGEK